jgi:hypothetical protein
MALSAMRARGECGRADAIHRFMKIGVVSFGVQMGHGDGSCNVKRIVGGWSILMLLIVVFPPME